MRILITYQYFLPAYKAGGPIQSVNNLARILASPLHEIYILCSDKDLDNSELNIEVNKWIAYTTNVQVYYNGESSSYKKITDVISSVKPDVIFINGLYSLPFTIYPLLFNRNVRKILSVRGMLHPGALSQKPLKKKLFLLLFKVLSLHKYCEYHSTTQEETEYIKNILGTKGKVWTITNLPNALNYQQPLVKDSKNIRLVSISLISPMKNIHCVLEALRAAKANIIYDIYGPVKDHAYWAECAKQMSGLPANITVEYKGEVQPHMVKDILAQYHYFILPSKSENFGHAIYEALSAGKPVITSNNTPWNGLEEAGAGYNINPEDSSALAGLLDNIALVDDKVYTKATINARDYITRQYNLEKIKEQYKNMFSGREI